MQLMLDAARPNRLQRKAIPDLRERAVAFQARVEDLEFAAAGGSAAVCSRPAQCIPAFSGDSPDFAGEAFGIDRLKRV